jgi:TfoX/Sxy family transcriptional regulator of competence genes
VALDQDLLARVRERLLSMADIEEKAIVGGTGFMLRRRLICGVVAQGLLVRVASPNQHGLLSEDGASPMVIGGKSSTGWLVVPTSSLRRTPLLEKWVARAIEPAAVAAYRESGSATDCQ